MNESRSLAQDFIYYEQLRVMVHTNDSRSWVEGYGCYEQQSIMDDMYD